MDEDDNAPEDNIEICMDPITDDELNYLAAQLFQMLDREEAEAAAAKALRQAREK